jgi:hypothetical protein
MWVKVSLAQGWGRVYFARADSLERRGGFLKGDGLAVLLNRGCSHLLYFALVI